MAPSPAPHDLARDDLAPALRAWAYWAGCGEAPREALPGSLRWLLARWDAGDDHLPLGLVHDLGYLLLRGRDFVFASARALTHWPPAERAARLAYEDRVLGRWALDPSVTEAHVAIAGMAARHRDAAVAHAVGLALAGPLRALASGVLASGNPAHLRAGSEALAADVPAVFEGWLGTLDETWIDWAREQLAAALAVLPTERLFGAEDLWEIAHLPELPSESARLALREVNGTAARVGAVGPTVALRVRRDTREVPVEATEADQYPAGGFDAISTHGAFENLVRTEIAYVGEGRTATSTIDLFDVRYVEDELLFYTRDESPMLDARRDVVLVIDRPAELRFKQRALPAQTLVLVESLVLALQADLVRVFGPTGARVGIVWRAATPEDHDVAREEGALLGFTLAAEVAHRRVGLSVAADWTEVPERGRVVFSPRAAEPRTAALAWVRVGGESWQVEHRDDARFDLRTGATALRALADALLLLVARGGHEPGGHRARGSRG